MPKLDFKSELELNPLMQDMGIKNIFNGKKADFSKMFVSDGENKSEGGIYVSKAKQNSRTVSYTHLDVYKRQQQDSRRTDVQQ